ncbi:ANK REP REGION domain-containing protein [Citrus sinensis]|nr:ANK REP REGION domain-containing protein [Citrus sinensis]
MESKLYEAALAGSVTSLLEFLQKDRLILERAAMNCPSETPLHVAALLRHKDFAKEILRQKPGIAGELDSRKSSALHIASQKRYVGMLEALKVLLENTDDSEFLNAKDDYGMSILHLAVADKQIEYYNQSECCYANGFTAWDILANSKRKMKDWEIGELLRRAGAISAKEMQQPATKVSITQTNSLTSHGNNQKKEASLIATMTFQAGVDPPHSRWQDASSFELDATTQRYACFLFCNTTGFLASLSIILLLISGLPLNRRIFMWILMGTRGLPSQQWY